MHATVLTLLLMVGGCHGDCEGGGCHPGHELHWSQKLGCGPMPQTCYSPRYGCYPGNSRYIHRYPAFHGAYYRRPYNYRNAFDYPWHAEMHEPTSLFSYNTYDPALESIEMGENYSQVLPGGEPEMFVPLGHDSRIKRVRSEPPSVRPLGK